MNIILVFSSNFDYDYDHLLHYGHYHDLHNPVGHPHGVHDVYVLKVHSSDDDGHILQGDDPILPGGKPIDR